LFVLLAGCVFAFSARCGAIGLSVIASLVAAMLLSAASAERVLAAPVWQPATVVAAVQSPTGASVALDNKGNAIVVWEVREQSGSGGLQQLVVASYRQAGSDGWGKPVALGPSVIDRANYGYRKPEVAFDGAGNATVVWIAQEFSSPSVVMSATRAAGTGKWTTQVARATTCCVVEQPEIGIDAAGDAMVTASFGSTWYRPAGGSWGPETTPAFEYYEVENQRLAVAADGSMLLVGGDVYPAVNAVIGDRGVWSAPVVLAKGSAALGPLPVFTAGAVAPGGDAVVTWASHEHGNSIVRAALWAGGVWQPATAISFADGNAYLPAVGMDAGGDVLAIWDATVDAEASFKPAGSGTWQRPVAVSAPTDHAIPSLAMNANGRAVAAWVGHAATGLPVAESYYVPGVGWGPAQTLGSEQSHSIEDVPDTAIDPAGDAITVWPSDQGTGASGTLENIESAVLDADGPLMHAVFNHVPPRIIGAAAVHNRLSCTTGSWSGAAPISFRFRWLRGISPPESAAHAGGPQIVGVARTYRVARSDLGRSLICRVTATNMFGPVAATSGPLHIR
jgi:hypothetical protein